MKFLAFVCADDDLLLPAPENTIEEWLASTPQRVEGHRLRGREDATTVLDHGALITDGPFADTKEWIAGYDILDCSSLDEAIEIAARHPLARYGAIELRPFRD
ncbi:transcription initiation protein [Actinoplanes sp. OR16]|uniref:YciI family protein n=1 Tax=Actinoplanes sp. OR16 TaxID=946334 RepID=UPI000F6B3D14|nr:YciI family protein [Actinoplanes sp. OR16]BBH71637.1 transcription initiation protein [Actinoplanes sp. OR16]